MCDIGKRFPFDAYPQGWFQVAYSREIDAYCPHLGADIAVGGTVAGDCVICSFHGWRFDGSGSTENIPIWENKIYRDRPQLARGEGAITEFRAWRSYEEAHQ